MWFIHIGDVWSTMNIWAFVCSNMIDLAQRFICNEQIFNQIFEQMFSFAEWIASNEMSYTVNKIVEQPVDLQLHANEIVKQS